MALGKKTGGRVKGTPNKTTASVRAALEEAFERMGGVDALLAWASQEPTEFFKLYAKLLPVQVNADHTHQGAVQITVNTGIPRAPDDPL